MTTQEMHIEIDLLLQKVNSQSTKNILPQEKDWFLNNEVIKYIQSKVNPDSNVKQLGFEDTAKRVEDIKDLIRTDNRPIQTNNRGEKYITFPSDYFAYIRFDSLMYKDCINTIASIPVNQYKSTFRITVSNTTITTYNIDVNIEGTLINLFTLTDLPSGYLVNAEFNKQKFLLIKALKILLPKKVKEILSPNTELYWEKEGTSYNASCFTVVSDIAITSIVVTANTNVSTFSVTSSILNITPIEKLPLKAKIRVVDDEYLTDIENSSLSKSRANSPVSVIQENTLKLSSLSDAIYGSINITYICMPNIIDLLLDSDLNTSDKVAKEVVGNTIRTLKGILESQDYQVYAQENILTE